MQDLMEDTQDQEMSQKMKDNAQKMRENELQEAGQEQQKMSEQLDQLSSQMDQMQMSMQGAQMQLNIAAIRSALEDVADTVRTPGVPATRCLANERRLSPSARCCSITTRP